MNRMLKLFGSIHGCVQMYCLMFYRHFVTYHISILDVIYKQHTVNKSAYFCSRKELHY